MEERGRALRSRELLRFPPLALVIASFVFAGTALAVDTDGDGLEDADETGIYLTNPADPDTDDDLLLDGFEVDYGFDPLDPDENTNGRIDGQDDTDSDGLGNAAEQAVGTSPIDADSDGDGLSDGEESASVVFASPQLISSAGAGVNPPELSAQDVDGDGDLDLVTGQLGSIPVAYLENVDGVAGSWSTQPISTHPGTTIAVATADIDGDGDIDALSATANDLLWHENTDAAGTFAPGQTIASSAFDIDDIKATDIDGDGDLDLLSGDAGGGLAWYENTDGAGTFGPLQVLSTAGDTFNAILPFDADGDGDVDLAFAERINGKLAWIENTDGAGTFGAPSLIATGLGSLRSLTAADFDGDGDTDLASEGAGEVVAWYENSDGAGSFGAAQPAVTSAEWPRELQAVDLDFDGHPDLLMASDTRNRLSWLSNDDGLGTFGNLTDIATGPGYLRVIAADLDGDADLDIVSVRETSGEIEWYEHVNLGDPLDPDMDDDGLSDGDEVNVHGTDRANPDTDGDGLSDGDEVNVYGSNPLQTDSDGDSLSDGDEVNVHGSNPASVDTDGDGLADDWELRWGFDLLGTDESGADPDSDGLTNLEEQTWATNPLDPDTDNDGFSDGDEVNLHGTSPTGSANDPDGDGLASDFELAWGFDPSDPDEDLNGRLDGFDDADGDGLGNAVEQAAGTDPTNSDTDGDGLPDGVELGTGTFGEAQPIPGTGARRESVAIPADLDGDLDPDVVWMGSRLSWSENTDGAGGFGVRQSISTSLTSPTIYRGAAVADLDGDGHLDAIGSIAVLNQLFWHSNTDGMGTFGAAAVLGTNQDFGRTVVATDLDSDGDADLVTLRFIDGNQIDWLENADGWGASVRPSPSPPAPPCSHRRCRLPTSTGTESRTSWLPEALPTESSGMPTPAKPRPLPAHR